MLYAQTDPRELPKVKKAIAQSNHEALHAFSRIAVVIFLSSIILSQAFGIESKIEQIAGMSVGLGLSLMIYLLNYLVVPKSPRLLPFLVLLFELTLFVFGFLLAFVDSPDQLSISLLIMLAIVPMFFTEWPLKMVVLYVIVDAIFVHLVALFKPEDVIGEDIANMLIYSSVGLILGAYNTRMKLERFIFENRVAELTNQEQLTRYLKSISSIFVSMYHADIDTGMFVEIKDAKKTYPAYNSATNRFEDHLRNGTKETADPDFLAAALRFVDVKTLKKRLKGKVTITYEFISVNGIWCRARFVNVDFDKVDQEPRYVIFAVENINEEKNREKELISQAETDAMTGLYNRAGGVSKIKEMLHSGKKGMLCLFDVDKFKAINDNFGHQVGDKVIVAVADAMRKTFRDGDVLLRLGGDEYMVFLNKVTTEELGSIAVGRFFAELGKTIVEGHEDYQICVSLGATFFKGGKVDFDELYKQADTCTYESKKIEGRAFTFWRG